MFDRAILQPETQDLESFADGIKYIVEAQQRSAQQYFDDGSIELACPPLRALLSIMAFGTFEGKTERDPAIRQMFTKEALLSSDWYRERLLTQQKRDLQLWERHQNYLKQYQQDRPNADPAVREAIHHRLLIVTSELDRIQQPAYVDELFGTLGAEPRL